MKKNMVIGGWWLDERRWQGMVMMVRWWMDQEP